MTENGKDYGISIFLIYILIFCNAYLTKKKNPPRVEMGLSCLLGNRCLNCVDEYLSNISNFDYPFCISLVPKIPNWWPPALILWYVTKTMQRSFYWGFLSFINRSPSMSVLHCQKPWNDFGEVGILKAHLKEPGLTSGWGSYQEKLRLHTEGERLMWKNELRCI